MSALPEEHRRHKLNGEEDGDYFSHDALSRITTHRPPSADFSKLQNSKAPVPSAIGGSVQR